MNSISMTASDVSLLTALVSPSLLGPNSGLLFDGEKLNYPDGALATAINAIVANTNWRVLANSAQLAAYVASARYGKETGGITVASKPVATDRSSQAQIAGALLTVQVNPASTIQWKYADGSFAALNAAAITTLANAVSSFVQSCFAAEATVRSGLAASPPTITQKSDVDAALAAISTAF